MISPCLARTARFQLPPAARAVDDGRGAGPAGAMPRGDRTNARGEHRRGKSRRPRLVAPSGELPQQVQQLEGDEQREPARSSHAGTRWARGRRSARHSPGHGRARDRNAARAREQSDAYVRRETREIALIRRWLHAKASGPEAMIPARRMSTERQAILVLSDDFAHDLFAKYLTDEGWRLHAHDTRRADEAPSVEEVGSTRPTRVA